MNPDVLAWLFARQRFGVHPGLERVRDLLRRLGDPQIAFRTVLVGGTNGKGSASASLAGMFRAGGVRAGLFTSPHLTRFSERFVVDGRELDGATVEAALARVRPHAEAVQASFFEIVTATGCLLFAEAGVTWAVMEVGLGGRLDATNALQPHLSVVTNVGLDHTAILGGTREEIAAEKSGILRAGLPAVTGVSAALLPILDAVGADLWALDREFAVRAEPLGWDGWDVHLRSPLGELSLRTPLLGTHGAGNAALAALAALRLGLPEQAVVTGAAGVRWPGRLERVAWRGGTVLLDGAHNPDGTKALRDALRGLGVERVPVVFGAAQDKDAGEMLRDLTPVMSSLILTRAALSPRAALPDDLLAHLKPGLPVIVTDSPAEALARLPDGALSVVCGSLYLIGEVRPLLLGEAGETHERWQ
ncbi:bifunctional folylpolyglutamate synthase/dihydrofolate synthase [Deinococcus aquiradiocola]|uniref:tetrahydrofolate synthase n=1 Tax=Deinococcus aquiradiocola TaxID=393059 RepID=A0A917UTP9_9DEIO|nr:folylpolyglutamate synthase/dihydrofolate synthase family protein [Deinococcus aquiradiocola]GGJ84421.1 folyl-polyglutamate synthetase [Deinococcus aquiradiocola]